MTPLQTAKLIGCSQSHVRYLCRRGLIKSKKVETPGGFYYDVDARSAVVYRDKPQTRGWPRGQQYDLVPVE